MKAEFTPDEVAAFKRRHALAEIDALERRQLRAMRELALGQPGAIERLQAIDDEITALRATLTS